MGFLRKRTAAERLLPPTVAKDLAEFGRSSWRMEPFELGAPRKPFEDTRDALIKLMKRGGPGQQAEAIAALAEVIVPVGGWSAYGATVTVTDGAGIPLEDANFCALLDASLDFQRKSGVWESQLAPYETIRWKQQHPGETWLEPQPPPTAEEASITPLEVGEGRPIGRITPAADSNTIYVVRRLPDEYVWFLDYADDESSTGGRLRDQRGSFPTLYELYRDLGQNGPLPPMWIDDEFKAFLRFPYPRL